MKAGDLVHSDIMGPIVSSFPNEFRYVSTFLDDYSRNVFFGSIQSRSMLMVVFKQVSAEVYDLGGFNISKVHSDGAKEYVASQNDLGGARGKRSFSPPHPPQMNAIAQRINRTIVDAALALLIQANVPRRLSPFVLNHVIYV